MWSIFKFTRQKSRFIGRAVHIQSIAQAHKLLLELKSVESKATHQIYALRCQGVEECKNDGEGNAGERLLQMLKFQKAEDVLVVVHRYFGGVQMGPGRFRAIDEAGFESVKQLLNK